MWFKQAKLFQLTESFRYTAEELTEQLEPLAFTPCLTSLPQSSGWVSPMMEEEGAPLAQAIHGYIMICLQIEDKILPATVVRQEVDKKVKELETSESRKVNQKEKYHLKNEITVTLLSRAFTKLTRIYAYIDKKNNCLVLSTANEKKAEQFISTLKKSIGKEIYSFEIKNLSFAMTQWLLHQNYPTSFAVEKKCMLQDPKQVNRIIRCQQQDLFANSIQALIKDGCEVKQLTLNWEDRINFILVNDFSLQSIQFNDEVTSQAEDMETETKQQQFTVDFLIMTETLSGLLKELFSLFLEKPTSHALTNESASEKIIEQAIAST